MIFYYTTHCGCMVLVLALAFQLLAFGAQTVKNDIVVLHFKTGRFARLLIQPGDIVHILNIRKHPATSAFDMVMLGQDMVETISAAGNGNFAQQAAFHQRIKVPVNSALTYIRIFHSDTVINFLGRRMIS